MKVQIAYKPMFCDWIVFPPTFCMAMIAPCLYAVVIDGHRTFENKSFAHVQIVAKRLSETYRLSLSKRIPSPAMRMVDNALLS